MSWLRGDYGELHWFVFAIPGAIFIALMVYANLTTVNHNRKICEDKGGIYYEGGFGADNCVFPPKETK